MRCGPGGLRGPGSVATRLLRHPRADILVVFHGMYTVLAVAMALDNHACIGYNIAVLTCNA